MLAVDTLHQGCGLLIPLGAAFKASEAASMLAWGVVVELLLEIPLRRAQTTTDLQRHHLRTRRSAEDALDPAAPPQFVPQRPVVGGRAVK